MEPVRGRDPTPPPTRSGGGESTEPRAGARRGERSCAAAGRKTDGAEAPPLPPRTPRPAAETPAPGICHQRGERGKRCEGDGGLRSNHNRRSGVAGPGRTLRTGRPRLPAALPQNPPPSKEFRSQLEPTTATGRERGPLEAPQPDAAAARLSLSR